MQPVDIEQIIKRVKKVGFKEWLREELARAFRDARKNKRGTFNEHTYEERWLENIDLLVNAIIERHYEPGKSIAFVIYDPMVREIFAAPFIDRVVHHFLYNMQAGWWDRRFIKDSYSCREEKGTLFGIKRAQEMMRKASNNFTEEAYVIKLDIKGYFMSLPRQKLYERIRWGLYQQFSPYFESSEAFMVYDLCCFLWRKIIMDNPVKKAIWRGSGCFKNCVPAEKTLRAQPLGYGIVIGNTTSQLASNIYLDQLDRFIRINLGYKYYGRYVDDFFIIVPKSQYAKAKRDIKLIEQFLESLELTLHPRKRYYQSIYKGFSLLGARVYPHCIFPSNRFQGKFERILNGLSDGVIPETETLISYFGYMRHFDVNQYVFSLCEKYGLDPAPFFESESPSRRPLPDIVQDFCSPLPS